MPSSSLIVPEKPRTPPSPTWRWPPRPARLRPEPRRAASAWPSTISCSGSKKNSETRPSFPDPRYSDGRSRDQGTREPGNHANQGTGDPGARRNLSSRAKHTKPVSVAPFYVATSGADIGVGLGAGTYHHGRPRARRRRVPRWVVMGVAAVGAVTLIVIFGSTFLQLYRLEREAARLEQLQRDLEVQNTQLREEIKLLHTPQYIEKLAREQLGLVKPGEIALLLIQSPTDPSPRRPVSNGTERRPAQDGAGRQPPPTRPGWAGRVWNALRSLFDYLTLSA